MKFTKKNIPSEKYCIIDIWSSQIRALGFWYKNKKIHILHYHEKRQDTSYFVWSECINHQWLSENIGEILSIIEKASLQKFDNIILSYPFSEIEVFFRSVNYKRKNPEKLMNIWELEEVFSWIQKQILNGVSEEIESHTGRNFSDFHIILSEILSMKIDNTKVVKVLETQGAFINSEIRNIFIPKERYDFLKKICHSNKKKLSHVLPSEHCILDMFEEELCAIDLWESSTSISIRKKWWYRKIVKIPIGTWKLIEKIKLISSYSRSQIIESLRKWDDFRDEKQAFLKIWISSLCYTLRDVLGWEICPHNFYLHGGGMNNSFIKKALFDTNFSKHHIKMVSEIRILSENMSSILAHIDHISLEDISKIPLHMYALLIEMRKIISRESDVVAKSLKHATKKIRA